MTDCVLAAIERTARERPNDVALLDAHRSLTWGELWAEVVSQALRFTALGPRARVLAISNNSVAFATAILGALEAGAELHGLSPRTPTSVVTDIARRVSARLILRDDERPGADPILPPSAHGLALRSRELPRNGSLLLMTSGTTGLPRIVVRGMRAANHSAMNTARALGLSLGARSLIAIPLFHTYAIDQLTAALLAGSSVRLEAGFNAAKTRRALLSGEITHFPAVPTMLDAIARLKHQSKGPSKLEVVVSAGSSLPERVALTFAEALSIDVGQVYGSTELGTVTATVPGDPFGCVGRPLMDVEVRLLDREKPDLEQPVTPGEEGVVAIAAGSRFDGYLDAPGDPAEFVMTGDLGRVDAHGCLWLTGRASLLIDVGAVKVNPLEVEATLMRHPGVREAVVLPLAFNQTGSRLRAVIVPEEGREPTTEELRSYSREQLIDYKVPRVFEIRREVPRSPTGKILRRELMRELR